MKKENLLKSLLLLTVLVLTVVTSYGNNPPDSTKHTLINNSIKCFEEVKVLGSIINKTDSINRELEAKYNRTQFLAYTCVKSNVAITKENKELEDKVNKTKFWNKVITYCLVVETVFLLTFILVH
jgi:hypothetical protein